MNPTDAANLNIIEGDAIEITSEQGRIVRNLRFNHGLQRGMLYIPLAADGNNAVNLLALTSEEAPSALGQLCCTVDLQKSE